MPIEKMNKYIKYLIMILVVLLFAGCAAVTPRSTQEDWRKAEKVNTVAGWDAFMKNFPHPDDVKKAQEMKTIAAAPEPVKTEIKELMNAAGNSYKINQAAKKLGDMGANAAVAVPYLLKWLTDPQTYEWVNVHTDRKGGKSYHRTGQTFQGTYLRDVYDALLKIGSPAVEPIIARLAEETYKSKDGQYFINLLGDLKDPRALEPLVSILKAKKDKKDEFLTVAYIDANRISAALALGKIKDPRAVETLVLVINDEVESMGVQIAAAEALAKMNNPRGVDKLVSLLNYGKEAAVALAKMKDPRGIDQLISDMTNSKSYTAGSLFEDSLKEVMEVKYYPYPCTGGYKSDKCIKWWNNRKEEFLRIKNVYTGGSFIVEEYSTRADNLFAEDYSKKREKFRWPDKEKLAAGLINRINQKIIPLGYQLLQQSASTYLYNFYKNKKLIAAYLHDISNFSIDRQNRNFIFFARQLDNEYKGLYVRNDHVEKMTEKNESFINYFIHGFYPFYIGDDLTWCEIRKKGGGTTGNNTISWEGSVRNQKEILYKFSLEYTAEGIPVHFQEIEGNWVLSLDDGRVIRNSENLCQKFNHSGMWLYRPLKSKQFYFFTNKGDKKYRLSYDGKEIAGASYNFVGIDKAWKIYANDTMIWFAAMKDNQLYYVEAGNYE